MEDIEKQIVVDAEIYAYDISVDFSSKMRIDAFIAGAKSEAAKVFHQQGMYSKIELSMKLYECLGYIAKKHNIFINGNDLDNWIKQNL
jgi:hypothetical protein